jgi:hypothetical protein
MKWFMFVVFVHISQYGLENPTDVVFFQMDQQYNSMDECINDQPKQTIEQIKKFDFQYDWKVATCTDSQSTIYLYPVNPKKIKKEEPNKKNKEDIIWI